MIQSRYHDRWKLALILAVLFGYIALRGQEEPPRKSDRQLIYDLEMRVLALEHENKWEHDRRSPIYKPRGGNIEAQP